MLFPSKTVGIDGWMQINLAIFFDFNQNYRYFYIDPLLNFSPVNRFYVISNPVG
jgi:hypothetical protein